MFSKIITEIKSPESMKIAALAKVMMEDGKDVIDLALGQPDLMVDKLIIEKTYNYMQSGKTGYTNSQGIPELRRKISEYEHGKLGYNFSPENVLVTPGGKQAIYYSLKTIINAGDEVVVIEPCWLSYVELIKLVEGIPVIVKTDSKKGFIPTIFDINSKITSKTKAIIINNPNNPTGHVYSKELLKQIMDMCVEKNLFIIMDNIYDEIYFEDVNTNLPISPEFFNRAIVINGFSKSFSMTGFRIGYILCNNEIMTQLIKVHEQLATCASSISQYAALTALELPKSYLEERRKVFKDRLNTIVEICKDLSLNIIIPKGGIYCMLDVKQISSNSVIAAERILKECLVATVPGSAYGMSSEGYVRLSLTQDTDRLKEALTRINILTNSCEMEGQ